MTIKKILVMGLLVPALVSPAFAAGERAVRPAVKVVSEAPAAQNRSLTVRSSTRTGAELESSNALIGLPLLFLLAGAAAVAAAVAVAASGQASSPA
jgi:hypothetical protein